MEKDIEVKLVNHKTKAEELETDLSPNMKLKDAKKYLEEEEGLKPFEFVNQSGVRLGSTKTV